MKVLRSLRKEQNKTQQDVATYLGITYQAYAHYESGRREPDPVTLNKLADYFEVSVDFLLGRTDDRIKKSPDDELVEDYQAVAELFRRADIDIKTFDDHKLELLASYAKGLRDNDKK